MNLNAIRNRTPQAHAFFLIEQLEGQRRIADKLAEIHNVKIHFHGAVVHPGHFQHILDQRAHLIGHTQDIAGIGSPFFLAQVLALHQLRIGHDDGQGCFQLMGRIGHKLPLLIPGSCHRLDDPMGKQNADAKKYDHGSEENRETTVK